MLTLRGGLLTCNDRLAQSASCFPEETSSLQGQCLIDMESSKGQRSWKSLKPKAQIRDSPRHLGSQLCVLGSPLIYSFQQPLPPIPPELPERACHLCHEERVLVTEQGHPCALGSVQQRETSTEASSIHEKTQPLTRKCGLDEGNVLFCRWRGV